MRVSNKLASRRNVLSMAVAWLGAVTVGRVWANSVDSNGQSTNEMSITVIVSFETKTENQKEFSKMMNNLKTELPSVQGCLGVDIFRSSTNKNAFTIVESWQAKEMHQIHLNKIISDGTWDTLASMLSKDPQSDYFQKI